MSKETSTLRFPGGAARFALVATVAFATAWLALILLDRMRPADRPAQDRTAEAQAAERARRFPGWDRNRVRVVAEGVLRGGLPVPLEARQSYQLEEAGRWQGFYASPASPSEVVRFYADRMPRAGWRTDRSFSEALTREVEGASVAFRLGTAQALLSVFPAAGNREGADFRLSVIRRPQTERK